MEMQWKQPQPERPRNPLLASTRSPGRRRVASVDACPLRGEDGRVETTSRRQGENAMRGVVFLGDRQLELRDFSDPTPGPGEVVLAMKASGMCGSDLHPYRASRQGGAAASLGLG